MDLRAMALAAVRAILIALLCASVGAPACADNLLLNSGFEQQGRAVVTTGPFTGTYKEWTYVVSTSVPFGIMPESLATNYGGPPEIESGLDALRVFLTAKSTGQPSLVVRQDVSVFADTDYTAETWVRAVRTGPGGFGDSSGDSAGLTITELTADGTEVVTHQKSELNVPSEDYVPVGLAFHTGPETATVRYSLETVLGCRYNLGFVSYDDCILEGPRLPGMRLADVKRLPDGTPVGVHGKTVTAAFGDCFYIEEPERVCGIRVNGQGGVGDVVSVVGTCATVGDERAIAAMSVQKTGVGTRIAPLGMSNSWLGAGRLGLQEGVSGWQVTKDANGKPLRAWSSAVGLNNIGLLVRTTGVVSSVSVAPDGSSELAVSDGSDVGTSVTGAYGAFAVDDFVLVTGVSSTQSVSGERRSSIRATGVEVVRPERQFTVTSLLPAQGTAFPPGLIRMDYTSAVDGRADWSLLLPPTRGDTWVVHCHGHGSNGDQLYLRPDTRALCLPAYQSYGLGVMTPNLRDSAWMCPAAARDLHDQLEYVRTHYGAKRFLLISGSMGATSNLIYAVLHPDDVAGVFAACPATDLTTYYDWCQAHLGGLIQQIADAIRVAYGGPPAKQQDAYARHSALLNRTKLTMPVFLAHGTADAVIPVAESRQLAQNMPQTPNFQYKEVPNGDHDSRFFTYFTEGLNWLTGKLGISEQIAVPGGEHPGGKN